MNLNSIRNFSIIAHIDHGKSTLADRMLEVTSSVDDRNMKEQMLDSMELERERGITIKMQPVRMVFKSSQGDKVKEDSDSEYILNLIDTPGHIDFSYEVSRALKAVEGAVVLVDSTQGVQAQTLTTLDIAKELGLTIIPVISKIDAPHARVDEVTLELADILDCSPEDVLKTSGKTGEGVVNLLEKIIEIVPPPPVNNDDFLKALVFDFEYSSHRGVIVYTRLFSGAIRSGDKVHFKVAKAQFTANEVGVFSPDLKPMDSLESGEIGYITTGIKKPGVASVGDTVCKIGDSTEPLAGYKNPAPVVWASVFPESQDDFDYVRRALDRLKMEDSSFSFDEEYSRILGRGFRCGFLGMLHLEIITERLKREFNLNLVVTSPSTRYVVVYQDGTEETVYTPSDFPDNHQFSEIKEPVVEITVITPSEMIGSVTQVLYDHEAKVGSSENFGDNRTSITALMPLRELMRAFFDDMKRVTSGYASISYKLSGMASADVVRMDILVAEEEVSALTRVVSREKSEHEARKVVEQLYDLLPRQQFSTKVQARVGGRIVSSKTLSALKKDVTAKLYGGDITRKMKLREKQKKGKKKMKATGRVDIPHDVFLKMMRQQNSSE